MKGMEDFEMMKARVYAFLFVLILVGSSFAPLVPAAHALPTSSIDTEYYDCCGYWIGEKILDCSGGTTNLGTTAGAHWRHITVTKCDGSEQEEFWDVWNGSAWVTATSYPVPGNCVC